MTRKLPLLVFLAIVTVAGSTTTASSSPPGITLPTTSQQTGAYDAARPFGTLRQQAKIQQEWVRERLEINLPRIMREQGVDMWIMSMREYNEDPVFRALVSPTSFAARRRTMCFSTEGSVKVWNDWRLAAVHRVVYTKHFERTCRLQRPSRQSCGERVSGAC